MSNRRLRIVGPGRAGLSLARATESVGWAEVQILKRGDDLRRAASEADLVVLATPDHAIAEVAAQIEPADAVLAHLAGSQTLDVLAPHRCASLHPLASLPDPTTGAQRLLDDCWFAIAGDPIVGELARALGGRAFEVPDDVRGLYHAAAAVAANHTVALLAQVERLAERAQVPIEAYWQMTSSVLANVAAAGAAPSLTGPAARGDQVTIDAHRAALPEQEWPLYRCLASAAADLARQSLDLD